MRKWILLGLLVIAAVNPVAVSAQNQISLSTFSVQLWPEFDQPSMLVILDFTLDQAATLPVDLAMRIPPESNLIAVAYEQDGNLLNVPFEQPGLDGDWQVVPIRVDMNTTYHIEYYAPLTRVDQQRKYEFLWPGEYAITDFLLRLKVPVDTTDIKTDPVMTETDPTTSGDRYLEWGAKNLEAGQQVPVSISYIKTSDRLSTSGAALQTGTVDESTSGRVSLNNYLPYILAGLGFLLIVVGGIYFWQSGQRQTRPRKRQRRSEQASTDIQVYCHQCGSRAQSGDRFCRICGTRIRLDN
jgi:ribosomal protein L32